MTLELVRPLRDARIDAVEAQLTFAARGEHWLYVPDLQPDEALLIKCWDSDTSVAQFAPHTGFENPTTPPGTPPRQSIEFRTIAFFD